MALDLGGVFPKFHFLYNLAQYSIGLFPNMPFQLSLMFVGKNRSLE
jgi:hypothetical protein